MYRRIEELSVHILAAVIIADCLTVLAVWYEIFYNVNDSWTETVKAILLDAAASVAVAILITGTVDTVMVLHKLMLEPYLKRRFNEGRAQGLAQGRAEAEKEIDAKLLEWNNRRLSAEARGERFDEPPPVFSDSES